VYDDMVISDMPHEEDPEHFDSIVMHLRLRQILYFAPGTPQALPADYSPEDPDDADVVQSGLQQPEDLEAAAEESFFIEGS
jgi:hypothetical protein